MPTITLSDHLIRQAEKKSIPLAVIQAVLRNPGITYQSFAKDKGGKRVPRCCDRHGVQQQKWTGEAFGKKVCIAVNVCCSRAVTVWDDQVETEVRDDQKKNGVKGYIGRDGKWRPA